jgi:hypothetical protein
MHNEVSMSGVSGVAAAQSTQVQMDLRTAITTRMIDQTRTMQRQVLQLVEDATAHGDTRPASAAATARLDVRA